MSSRDAIRQWERFDRPREGRLLGGVCAALAERFRLHVWLVRIAFVVLGLADGIGVAVYLLLWFLFPVEGEQFGRQPRFRTALQSRLHAFLAEVRGGVQSVGAAWRRGEPSVWPRPLTRRWIALVVIAVGAFVVLASFGVFDWITPVRAFGFAIMAVGAGILVSLYRR